MRIFAHSSTREQSNKRSGTRLKTESETPRFTGFFTGFEKKNPTVLQSRSVVVRCLLLRTICFLILGITRVKRAMGLTVLLSEGQTFYF